jgi:hypothetical protein
MNISEHCWHLLHDQAALLPRNEPPYSLDRRLMSRNGNNTSACVPWTSAVMATDLCDTLYLQCWLPEELHSCVIVRTRVCTASSSSDIQIRQNAWYIALAMLHSATNSSQRYSRQAASICINGYTVLAITAIMIMKTFTASYNYGRGQESCNESAQCTTLFTDNGVLNCGIIWCLLKKYSYPRNRPWRPIGLWDV